MDLASQGHDLDRIFDGYPVQVVKGLMAASHIRRRLRLAEQGAALSVAVTGALDLVLNQGKGKVLERWFEELTDDKEPKAHRDKPKMTDRAFNFFAAMPKKTKNG